jgi:hypothetical protein
MTKVTADIILGYLKAQIESKCPISREVWTDLSFRLNLLLGDEIHELEALRQKVAQRKYELYKVQEKKNVSAVDLEIEASDDYRLMRERDAKVEQIKEFIRLAKKNMDNF